MSEEYFYGIEDTEILQSDVQTAVEDYLCRIDIELLLLPKEVTLNVYTKSKIEYYSLNILDNIIENLEEKYGNPDNEFIITDRLNAAEKEFVKILIEEYEPWVCHHKYSEILNLHEWISDNNWLDGWIYFGI